MFGRGGPMGVPGTGAGGVPGRDAAENKVMVDLGLEFDPQKADSEIKLLRADLEKANASYEREVADGKRVRAEAATLRERIEEVRAQVKDREEQVSAHDRVADELRDELQQTRNELSKQRNEMSELAENMAARERQAARAVEDTAKIRDDMEDLNRQLMELSRTKDEGWKKLNEQLTEIEHLREVINEQERMLEERRVGLISQEEVIKELRADKEKSLKSIAHLRAERDEAATTVSRTAAQIVALEEENRRMGRMLVEAQTDASRGGGGNVDHMMRLSNELKEARVDYKKVEADRDRLNEQYDRADTDRQKLEGRLAQIEVELQETQHGKFAAESARNVAQDALAKAELARHKSAEEALNASKARDVASVGGDDARRELDRLRKRVAELDAKGPAVAAADPKELQLEREAAERALKTSIERAAAAERTQKSMQAELDAAKTDAAKARAEAARARAAADAQAVSVLDQSPKPGGDNAEIAKVAREVYEAINDILSEMRNNMILISKELQSLNADGQAKQAMTDAVDALVDNAETAKGALRGLRDLSEAK
jgi:chromosome segregation ATPase